MLKISPSGADIRKFFWDADLEYGVVLAHWRGPQPWVTWNCYPDKTDPDASWICEVGHYFSDAERAFADFIDRLPNLIKRNIEDKVNPKYDSDPEGQT